MLFVKVPLSKGDALLRSDDASTFHKTKHFGTLLLDPSLTRLIEQRDAALSGALVNPSGMRGPARSSSNSRILSAKTSRRLRAAGFAQQRRR
jgi:hypothetical protein